MLKQHLLDDIEQEIRQRLAAEQESRLKARVASKILKKRRKKKRSKVVATAVAVIDQTEVPIDLIHTESNCICIYEECDDNGSKSADLKNEVEDDTDDHFDDDEDNDDVYGDDDCADEGNDDDDYSIDCNGDRFDNDSDNSDVAETKEEYIPWVDKPVCEIKEHQNVDKIPIPHYTDKYTEESNKESILSGNKDVAEKVKSGKSRRSSADKSVKSQKSYSHKSIKSISTKIVAKEESHAQSSDTQTYIQHHHLPQVLHHLRLAQSCLLQNDIDNISHHLKSALSLDPSDILTLTIKANYTYKFSNDSMEATEKMFSNALYKCLPSLYKSLVLMQCNSEVDSASGSIIDNFNLDTGDVEYDYRVCDIVYLLLSYTEFLLAIDQGAYSTMSVSKTTLLLHKCIQIQPTNNRAQELLEGISNIHIV